MRHRHRRDDGTALWRARPYLEMADSIGATLVQQVDTLNLTMYFGVWHNDPWQVDKASAQRGLTFCKASRCTCDILRKAYTTSYSALDYMHKHTCCGEALQGMEDLMRRLRTSTAITSFSCASRQQLAAWNLH